MTFDTKFRFDTGLLFFMSSFNKDGFSSRGMTCDVLKMSGKTPEIKDKLEVSVYHVKHPKRLPLALFKSKLYIKYNFSR